MSLKTQITDAMKDAMRSKNKPRLAAIRLILADIKRIEVDERIEVDDQRVVSILDKMRKQRNDSISQFSAAGRDDLVAIEQGELEVIAEFLPAPLSENEVTAIVNKAIQDCVASGMQDMGKVMGVVKPQVQGRADMGAVSKQVKAALAG
jgi:uncharacterized protein